MVDKFLDLFKSKNVATVVTLNPNGTPHAAPMWFLYDEKTKELQVNTARGRIKERNIMKNKHIALCIIDNTNPLHYVTCAGQVKEITEKGAIEHIHKLSQKYMGKDYPWLNAKETRVKIIIKPEHIYGQG